MISDNQFPFCQGSFPVYGGGGVVPDVKEIGQVTLTGNPSNRQIILDWTVPLVYPFDMAIDYVVETDDDTLSISGTTTTITDLPLGQEKTFKVRAKETNGDTVSEWSNTVTFNQAYQAMVLSSASKTDSSISISTTNPDSLGEIELYMDDVLIQSGADTTWTISDLTANTEYVFTVRGTDEKGEWSGMSSPLAITTDEEVVEEPEDPEDP